MTKEEAIKAIEGYLDTADEAGHIFPIKFLTALDVAISALSENKGDLISRQAVINAIANTCFWLSADNWDELIKCINSIPSVENKGEWIPVSERLPEKNVWVLVTVEQSGNRYQEIMRRNNYVEAWTDNIDNYTDEITAWQPLPEPYKKGE